MSNELEIITKSKLESYLQIAGVAANLTKEETENFLNIAMDFNLNPFKREIYCTSYGEGEYRKTSIITGYEVYIKRAERTGQLEGWGVETFGSVEKNDLVATITIHRKDRKFPFVHTVDYAEYAQKVWDKKANSWKINSIWAGKPKTMLKKVVTGQGFRLCFSDELGGIPYDSSELPIEEKEIIQKANIELPQEVKKQIIVNENKVEKAIEAKEPYSKLPDLKSKIASSTKTGKELLSSVKNMKKVLDRDFSDCTDYSECLSYLDDLELRLTDELNTVKEVFNESV